MPLLLGTGWNVQGADVLVVVFHVAFDFQGLVLVDVLPHFCNDGPTDLFIENSNTHDCWCSEEEPERFCSRWELLIISSGRNEASSFRAPQNDPLRFLRTSGLFTTAIRTRIIQTHTHARHGRRLPSFPSFLSLSTLPPELLMKGADGLFC